MDDASQDKDKAYLSLLLDPLLKCAKYKPKMGHGGDIGVDLAEFRRMYQGDAFYNWFGLDNPLMYAAHKAAGGMTSVYRQIGAGCERLFRRVLCDQLNLTAEDCVWSYSIVGTNKKSRELSLDGRIPLDSVPDQSNRQRVAEWLKAAASDLNVDDAIAANLKGAVFEVRQGYKSKDAKRQNADISNAATAYTKAYLPCCVVLSTQFDGDLAARYRNEKWTLLVGDANSNNTLGSTYAFMRDVVGYDLAAFFAQFESVADGNG